MGRSGSVATTFNQMSFVESANMTLPGIPVLPKFRDYDDRANSPRMHSRATSKSERKDAASQVDSNIAVEVFIKGSQVNEATQKDTKRKTVQIPKTRKLRRSRETIPTEPVEERNKSSLHMQPVERDDSPTRFKVYEFTTNPEFTKAASSTKKFDVGDTLARTKKDGTFGSGFLKEPRLKSIARNSS